MSRWKNHQGAGKKLWGWWTCLPSCLCWWLHGHTQQNLASVHFTYMQIILCQLPLDKTVERERHRLASLDPTLCERGVPVTCLQLKARSLRHPGLSASPIRTLAGCSQGKWTTPASLFSGFHNISTDSGTYKLHLSVHLLLQPFLNPPPHISEWPLPSGTGQHPCLLLLPPPHYFLWLPRVGRTEKGMKRSLHLRPEAQGGPYHRQSLQQCWKRHKVPFFFTLLLLLVIRHSI